MANKFTQGSSNTRALTDFNNVVDTLNDGNFIPEKTEAEILAIVGTGKNILVHNTTTGQLEYWRGTTRKVIA